MEVRNKIAGYATHLMKRIGKGPVRGISLRLQEEERERKDNYVPDVSAIDVENIEIDAETKAMLRHMEMGNLPGIQLIQVPTLGSERQNRPRRNPNQNAPKQNQQPQQAQVPATQS